MTYTIFDIYRKLRWEFPDITYDDVKNIGKTHRLKRIELGHGATWFREGVETPGYVYYDYTLDVFRSIWAAYCSENQEFYTMEQVFEKMEALNPDSEVYIADLYKWARRHRLRNEKLGKFDESEAENNEFGEKEFLYRRDSIGIFNSLYKAFCKYGEIHEYDV